MSAPSAQATSNCNLNAVYGATVANGGSEPKLTAHGSEAIAVAAQGDPKRMAQTCRPRYTYMLLRSLPKADTDALPSMIGSHDPFSGAFSDCRRAVIQARK